MTGGLSVRCRKLFIVSVSVLSLTLSGCSTWGLKVEAPTYQENLLVICPETLPMLTDGRADTLALVLRETQSIYFECAIPHNGLVDAIRETQE